MRLEKGLEALKRHAEEEVRIHREILQESKVDLKHLVRKHLKDTVAIHKAFWRDLKKAMK
jgi:hypothetical protein